MENGDVSRNCGRDDLRKERYFNMKRTIMDGVEKLKPKKDWNEGFAGRVVVTVELLGDLEE